MENSHATSDWKTVRIVARLTAILAITGLTNAQPALHLKGLRRELSGRVTVAEAPGKSRNLGRSHLLVQFAGNPGGDQLSELQNRGAAVLSYVPDFAFSISAPDDVALDGLGIQSAGQLAPEEKISPDLEESLFPGTSIEVLVEFYSDVDPYDGRAIAVESGLLIRENPDLLPHHLLVSGTPEQIWALASWDEVVYVFPASTDVIDGTPAHACAGALTAQGQVGQSVAIVGDGGDGPGGG